MTKYIVGGLAVLALALPGEASAHRHHGHKHHAHHRHHHAARAADCPAEEPLTGAALVAWQRETREAEQATPAEEAAAEARLQAYIATAAPETPAEEAANEAELDAEIAEAAGC